MLLETVIVLILFFSLVPVPKLLTIHILYTGCAKIKKNNSGAKRLIKNVTRNSRIDIILLLSSCVKNYTLFTFYIQGMLKLHTIHILRSPSVCPLPSSSLAPSCSRYSVQGYHKSKPHSSWAVFGI